MEIKRNLIEALDECLVLLENGSDIERCLVRYPGQAAELRPLLEVALAIDRIPPPTCDQTAFAAGKRRMMEALSEKNVLQQPSLQSRFAHWIAGLPGAIKSIDLSQWSHVPALPLAVAATAVLVLLVFGGLMLRPRLDATIARATTLESASGVVEIFHAESETWRSASASDQLEPGDRIRTGGQSTARLVFFDGSTAELRAGTEIALLQSSSQRDGSGKAIVLYQELGQIRNQVEPLQDRASRFEIETPTGVTAVRGTDFTVDVKTDGTTEIEVHEGLVAVTAQGTTILVQAGQTATMKPDQPPDYAERTDPTGEQESTPMPEVTDTSQPSETPEASEAPVPLGIPRPPGATRTPQPGLTETPEPSGDEETDEETDEPEPPGLTKTPQPPGLTKTPQPPGQTKTPQPPGQTKTPQPPGQENKPEPPGQENKPEPPGQSGGGGGKKK